MSVLQFAFVMNSNRKINCFLFHNILKNDESKTVSNDGYKMNSKPKGNLLIINNHFQQSPEERHGTDVDEKSLDTTFTALGFQVHF